MKKFHSILVKLVLSVAIAELAIMLAYEYFGPLRDLIEAYVFLGPIIDTALLTVVMIVIYVWMLKKPLDELLGVICAVAKKDFSRKANEKRKDEFGLIATHFNSMMETLENWNRDLEEKIKMRTKELHEANENLKFINEEVSATNEELQTTTEELRQANEEQHQANEELVELKENLEKKVNEHTAELQGAKKELEKKISNMERFNQVTVDRELKMKELKKRIRELEAKQTKDAEEC